MARLSGEKGLEFDVMAGGTISGTGIGYGISRIGSPNLYINSSESSLDLFFILGF